MIANIQIAALEQQKAGSASSPVFSIIAPVHNEEDVLRELYRRVRDVMDQTGEAWELLLIDDGSTDSSAALIASLNTADVRVRGISLSRNYGFQVAVSAGLDHAQGDAVVLIDADLQDPPEVILDMIERWQEGYEVVYGVRGERDGETWFKKVTASAFYRLIQRITNVDIPLDTGDFRLMDRRVVDAIKAMPERSRFLRGMVSWVGYRQTGVVYHRHSRYAGRTKFTLKKMVRFALDAITSFSYFPLQLASYVGFFFAGLSALAILVVIALRLFGADAPLMGQATTLVVVLFLGSVQLICLGIIGEYLGRIYDEVKARPLYLIDRKWGIEEAVK
ncbi:MAG: glycosyltransferase family 2 protein [Chloroflexi bacterium]|nr:glycosyltransferase family 2 protein [Chloroflexota bacterium]